MKIVSHFRQANIKTFWVAVCLLTRDGTESSGNVLYLHPTAAAAAVPKVPPYPRCSPNPGEAGEPVTHAHARPTPLPSSHASPGHASPSSAANTLDRHLATTALWARLGLGPGN